MKNFTGNSGNTNNPNGPGAGNTGGSGGSGGATGLPPGIPINLTGQNDKFDPLEMLTNYNEQFKNAGPTLFRDEVIQQVESVLIGKNKPNALLIGEAGVGKTKIVEAIAYRIASNDPTLPDKLRGCVIYELPLSNIVSGSRYVGDLEEKLKSVVRFLSDPDEHAIVFIDEIHQLCKSTNAQTYGQIAQILKPYLARGEIKTIGATTSQEANMLMDDPALNRRFSRIIVDEFTPEQTVAILKHIRPGFTMHYDNKIAMTDDLMESVVQLADEYSQAGSHRPDNAITLLDRACGEAIVQRKQQEMLAQADPNLLMALKAMPIIQITERQVKRTAIRIMTGNAKRRDFESDKTRDVMHENLKGQDDVIDIVIKLLRQYDLDLFPKKKPLTLLFAGDSGVGKTEMAKIIAKELTGGKPIILNMTEYHSSASINRIIGAPAGYAGSDSNRELPFDSLEGNPYQVILLDEFEKADISVQRLFMSAFDEGFIKTSFGKTVDFSRAIIIATTNAGHAGNKKRSLGFDTGTSDTKSQRTDNVNMLSKNFDVELLNRFREIVTFHSLDEATYREIVATIYKKEAARLNKERPRLKLPADIPDDDLDELVKTTYERKFGARPAANAVINYISEKA